MIYELTNQTILIISSMSTVNRKMKQMAQKINTEDPRAWLYLYALKPVLANYYKTDPRFNDMSECGRHLIEKGMEADKEDREKALKGIT